jgi:hypothetical protein
MSYLTFATPTTETRLAGPERHWLLHLAHGPAVAAWDLDRIDGLEHTEHILAIIPEVPDGPYGANYLHTYLREAQAEHRAAMATGGYAGSIAAHHRLIQSLKLRLTGPTGECTFRVGGITLDVTNINLNTALAAGSDPIRLAAKLAGWAHCWIDGPDRAWAADIIDAGREGGMYRTGMGWEDIATMLRARDDEPVVTSHSVETSFPSIDLAGMSPPWPDGVPRSWEAYDALPEQVRREREKAEERADEQWYELPKTEQWRLALAGLKQRRPWAQLSPATLGEIWFGATVTVYDLLADDREARVAAAANKIPVSSG